MPKKILLGALLCTFALISCTKNNDWKGKEKTLSIIKPDAVKNDHIGDIIARFEKNGLKVSAIKMKHLSQKEASEFYGDHKGKPFYKDLVTFMTSGPSVIMVLEGDNAVELNREIMGATDPSKAKPGTLRADFAKSTTENAVHGSDSRENARKEITFFFSGDDLQERF
jgi:nucleoside-diphosphate kinase